MLFLLSGSTQIKSFTLELDRRNFSVRFRSISAAIAESRQMKSTMSLTIESCPRYLLLEQTFHFMWGWHSFCAGLICRATMERQHKCDERFVRHKIAKRDRVMLSEMTKWAISLREVHLFSALRVFFYLSIVKSTPFNLNFNSSSTRIQLCIASSQKGSRLISRRAGHSPSIKQSLSKHHENIIWHIKCHLLSS